MEKGRGKEEGESEVGGRMGILREKKGKWIQKS